MRGGVETGAGATAPADRCEHAHRLTAGYAGCATFQAVTFIPLDSLSRELAPSVTCRHLTSGASPGVRGRFYSRCALGTPVERVRWLAEVTPALAAAARVLQAEIERICEPQIRRLVLAKSDLLDATSGIGTRRVQLQAQLQSFLDLCRGLITERRERFEALGVDVDTFVGVLEETCRAWLDSPSLSSGAVLSTTTLESLPPVMRIFLDAAMFDGARAAVEPVVAQALPGNGAIGEPGALHCTTTTAPAGLGFIGEIDASNSDRLAAHLASAGSGGGDVHVDLSGVVFCGVAGFRALVQASERLQGGRRLVVHGMPEHMRTAMRKAGWESVESLVFADPDAEKRRAPEALGLG